jgi:hypothetical protein
MTARSAVVLNSPIADPKLLDSVVIASESVSGALVEAAG